MSTRDKLRKFKSGVKSWISSTPESKTTSLPPPTHPPSQNLPPAPLRQDAGSSRATDSDRGTQLTRASHLATEPAVTEKLASSATSTFPNDRSDGWSCLRLFAKTLEHGARSFSPLREVVGGLIDCIETFENLSNELKEYEVLRGELNALFWELQGICAQTMPPAMTVTIESLCRSIQHELIHVKEVQARGRLRQYLEAENDVDEILACYRRIQNHFQRVLLNVDISTWRIVDEMATDNRLNRLSPSLSACYNSAQALGLKRGPCATGTRVDLMARLLGWTDGSTQGSVYWMNGMAGTGKTTIAYSLCQELDASRRLAASFFCSRLLPECRDINLIIPTVAYQLARCSHPFRCVLSGILENDPDVHTRLPHLQFDALIAKPLLQVKDTLPNHLVVVVDALDECDDKESTSLILDVLLTKSSVLPIRFVVSSRPEPEIRDEMVKQNDQAESRIVLHELDRHAVQADVETYLRAALAPMKPAEDEVAILVERAGVLFIYAATVVRYVGYDKFRRNPRARLANILSSSNATENKHKEIDELYSTILHAALDNPDLDDLDRQDAQQVLHTVICAQEPLAVSTLSSFLKLGDAGRVHAALRPLWSVLHVSGATELVTTLHASFPDFMLDPSRSKHYYCDLSVHNQILALRCFDCFRNVHPQFNICGLESSYLPDDKVEGLETRIQDAITAELFYAARYWAIHLTSAAKSADIIAELQEFFSMRLLLWMEVMNLKKCASSMPDAMQLLEKSTTECPIDLRSWMRDAWWFTKIFSLGTVSNSTPHIYTSMPLLLPESSPIAQCYTKRMKGVIRFQGNAVNRHRHPLVATWTFDAMVSTSTFSPDGARIALAVKFDILLLDSTTGRQIFPPFKGHKSIVDSIGFSPDGRYIVSGSRDSTVRIWSTQSGRLILGPLEHNDIHWIMFVAFLSDGTRVISGSDDSTICVWDARSGDRLLDWTTSPEKSFTFYASDGKYVASCNWKRDITVWNAQDGHVVRTLYHSNCEISWVLIGISPDGTQIASRSQYGDIYLWDIESGKLTLEITCNWVTQALAPVRPITFSSDGSRIASAFGASGEGIYVWDARVGRLVLGPLEGHAGGITSFKFSPNDHYIISSSTDKVLCLWDTRVLPPKSDPLQGHADSVLCVDYAPAGDRIITSSADNSTCVWDAESGEMVLEISIDSQGSRNISDISPDGTRVVSDTQAGFSLLDVQTGDVTLGLMKNRTPWLAQSAEFSPDSAHLLIASSSMNGDIRVVAADTGQTLMVIHLPPIRNSPNQQVLFAALSPNNSHIAVGSSEFSLTMYDTANGRLLYGPIDGYNCSKYSVSFSPDGTRVAAGSHPNICVRDAGTGKIVLGPLEGHTDSVTSIQFSRDGTRIVSCGYDNAVCLWDAETGQKLLGPARWHTGVVNSARISPNGNHVVTGSGDRTIRVTDIRHELNSISDSLAPTGSDWELKADGWVVDTEDRLIVWVPPELRASLARPRTKLLISRKGWFRLNFADALLGESWKGCYWPESLD